MSNTAVRTANHIVVTNNSEVVHAAADATVGPFWHVLACNGRAVRGAGWGKGEGTSLVTCKACTKAFAAGKAVWS